VWPVSVKGVLLGPAGVLLLRNEREEWELPGGRLEADETPETCLAREIAEELSIEATVGPLLDAYVFEVVPGRRVLILAYGCRADAAAAPELSHEHRELRWLPLQALDAEPLPEGYRRAIEQWDARCR
jgi:mutator protein MutT